ncbi:hypothetical protein HDV06_003863, partial [Boothiomyces sp. JEL0866]
MDVPNGVYKILPQNPQFQFFADENCQGNSTGIRVTPNIKGCSPYGIPYALQDFYSVVNSNLPPKSVILYNGNVTFGYPDYNTLIPFQCTNFSPEAIQIMSNLWVNPGQLDFSDKRLYSGTSCTDGSTLPGIPTFTRDIDRNVKIAFFEDTNCGGSSASAGVSGGDCSTTVFSNGLRDFLSAAQGTTAFQSFRIDSGSDFIMFTPSRNWVRYETGECQTFPDDVQQDLQRNVAIIPNNPFGSFKTMGRFCVAGAWTSNSTVASSNVSIVPTSPVSTTVLNSA